jgi:hypothetical protein
MKRIKNILIAVLLTALCSGNAFAASVTCNANGGTNAPTDNTNYAPNDIVTVAAAGSMTGPGAQTFIGWSKTAPVSGDIITPGSTFNIASNTTLYAVWSGDGSATHPFVVSDAEGLNAVRSNLTKHYILTADINARQAEICADDYREVRKIIYQKGTKK